VKPFRSVTARVAVLDRADVDTDQIIPKQFLKRIERTGYGEFLFFDWMKQPDFELRRPEYAGAGILLTGRNFGSGSSREHAAWALQEYGFEQDMQALGVHRPTFEPRARHHVLPTELVVRASTAPPRPDQEGS